MRDVDAWTFMFNMTGALRLNLKLIVRPLEPFDFDRDGIAETTYILTQDHVVSDSFSIESASQCGSNIEIGTCIAYELKFTLKNADGIFNSAKFEGAEITAYSVIPGEEGEDDTEIKLGVFTVDEHPRMGKLININALDRMAQFDRVIPRESSFWSSTLAFHALTHICNDCNVTTGTYRQANGNIRLYENDYFYTIGNEPFILGPIYYDPEIEITYRQALQYLCQLICCNAYMNANGKLCFRWYGMSKHHSEEVLWTQYSEPHTIDPEFAFQIQMDENDISIATLSVAKSDGTVVSYTPTNPPENGIEIRIENNPFADAIATPTKLQSLYNSRFLNFSYRSFSAVTLPNIAVEPLDEISITDEYGNTATTYAMNVTYKLNGKTAISAKGESSVKKGYATMDCMTAEESRILNKYKQNTEKKMSNIEKSAINFNVAMSEGVGLHYTELSGTRYYHDAETLSGSTYIMKQNSAGIAWTSGGWDGNDTVYEYGISSGGEALLNTVNAYRIKAELIICDNLSSISANIGGWEILDDSFSKSVMSGSDRYEVRICPPTPDSLGDGLLISSMVYENNEPDGSVLFSITNGGNAIFGGILYANGDITSGGSITAIGDVSATGDISATRFVYGQEFYLKTTTGYQSIRTAIRDITDAIDEMYRDHLRNFHGTII